MMNTVLGRILFGLFAPLPRERTHHRPSVDDPTRDAIVEAERARVAAWIAERALTERGIVVDDGCAGSAPRGIEITLALRDLVTEPLLITARDRKVHPLDALFDDIDLDGALRAIEITSEHVCLRFLPLRTTDACDVALRRVGELLAKRDVGPKNSPRGPYR